MILDGLVGGYEYLEGCEVNPVPVGCLDCPLPRCKYDDPAGFLRWRHRRVWHALEVEGLTVAAAAARFSVSQRTIWRIKRRQREAVA